MGVKTWLVPIEEMIALAAYVAERSRFDGAEIAHLIRSAKGKIDWDRVLELLGEDHQLLLWHLIFFDFVYPGRSKYLPQELMIQLFEEMRQRWSNPSRDIKAFRGTILDPFSFTVDVEDWGYEDQRIIDPLVDRKGERI